MAYRLRRKDFSSLCDGSTRAAILLYSRQLCFIPGRVVSYRLGQMYEVSALSLKALIGKPAQRFPGAPSLLWRAVTSPEPVGMRVALPDGEAVAPHRMHFILRTSTSPNSNFRFPLEARPQDGVTQR